MKINEMVRCAFLGIANDYGHLLYREVGGEERYILSMEDGLYFSYGNDWMDDKYDPSTRMDQILVVNGYEDYDFAESGWL